MKNPVSKLLIVVLTMTFSSSAFADQKPKNNRLVDPQKIARLYAGHTDIWTTNCNGGIYFSPNWQARAWCGDQSENLGVGTWTVKSDGQLCHKLTWYWPNGNRAGSSPGDETCLEHVKDFWGVVWRSFPNDQEWWEMGKYSGLTRGYKIKDGVRQARESLGF